MILLFAGLFGGGRALLDTLRRRRVGRWGAAYLASAWLLLQVVDLLSGAFDWPAAILRTVAILLTVGLPAVLIVAWYHGREGRQRVTRREVALLGGLLVLGLLALAVVPSGADPVAALSRVASSADIDRKAIAVLPFQSLSASEEDAWFADGVHEEILVSLSRVADLRVTSRASVRAFRGTDRDLGAIAEALGVGSVLEGSVRRDLDRVRISVRLVDPRTGQSLWAEGYERSLEDIFAIQSDVARSVATALRATLTPAAGRRPTVDTRAYDLYLRGREVLGRPGYSPDDLREAERLFAEAVGRDSGFAQAWANLGDVHVLAYRFGPDGGSDRLGRAREAIERALRLDPDLPEAHLAMGYYRYQGERDYEAALEEFSIVRRALPSHAAAAAAIGFIRRRQGLWEDAIEQLEEATLLDPLNADHFLALGTTLQAMRRHADARRAYDRMQALDPGSTSALLQRARLHVLAGGRTDSARTLLAGLRPEERRERFPTFVLWELAMQEGRWEDAIRILDQSSSLSFDGSDRVRPAPLLKAWTLEAMDEPGRARGLYDAARVLLEDRLRQQPDDARLHAALGLAYAGLGRAEEAVRAGRRAVELRPEAEDAMHGPRMAIDRALVLAAVGETEEALAEVERLLRVPSGLTVHEVRIDPRWAPLRRHPSFRRILGSGPA